MTASPEPTSMSGFARRVSAIFPPAMISPSTATATASGSIHCWSWPTAGSPARSGDGTCTHQVEVWVTIQVIPDSIAAAIPLSAPRRGGTGHGARDLADDNAGRGDEHGAGHQRPPPWPGKTVYPASEDSSAAEFPQSPPGGATTFQSPPSQTTSIWTEARTVAPLAPGPALTRSRMAAAGV